MAIHSRDAADFCGASEFYFNFDIQHTTLDMKTGNYRKTIKIYRKERKKISLVLFHVEVERILKVMAELKIAMNQSLFKVNLTIQCIFLFQLTHSDLRANPSHWNCNTSHMLFKV